MDRFLEMKVFTAVVDAGSFVAASDALEMSKATVSRTVAGLEARLGVRLLHRTTRRLSPTGEGQVFHARCRELLSQVDEAEAEITSRSGEAMGRLRVSAPVSFGIAHLAPVWGAFRSLHPRVSFDVTLSDRVVDLVEEGYDMAVRIGALADSTLVGLRLATTRLVMCASPHYLARHGEPLTPDDLAQHATIGYSYLATRDEWPLQGPDGPVHVATRPCLRANNGDTCRAAALSHQGIILQPSFLVGQDLREGRLVEVLPAYRGQALGIHAVYPTRRHVAPKVRLLVEHLAAHFRTPAWEDAAG